MAQPRKDALKVYAVVGLALIAVALAFRLVMKKKRAAGTSGGAVPQAVRSAIPPGVLRVPDTRSNAGGSRQGTGSVLKVVQRDIFSPPVPPEPVAPEVVEIEPVDTGPEFVLIGVMSSGKRLLANINNRLVAVGETIQGYTVWEITNTRVTLRSEKQTVVLSLSTGLPETPGEPKKQGAF